MKQIKMIKDDYYNTHTHLLYTSTYLLTIYIHNDNKIICHKRILCHSPIKTVCSRT